MGYAGNGRKYLRDTSLRIFRGGPRWAVLVRPLWDSTRDLLPIIGVVGLFQIVVFQKPIEDVVPIATGLAFVILGLTLFIAGLQMGLFPLGEGMAEDFARKGSAPWMIAFAIALGFGTTFAEPALIAVSGKAATLQGPGVDPAQFALVLRSTVAASVGLALALGVLRILRGWPLHYLMIGGYLLIMALTPFTPAGMIAIAYDSGAVTTSTITVPLTTALGVGLATHIRGRNPLLDGFGMIALASLTPILFVLLLGIVWQ